MEESNMNMKLWLAIIGAVGAGVAAIPAVIGAFKGPLPLSISIVNQGPGSINAPGGTVNAVTTITNVWNDYSNAWSDGVRTIVGSRSAAADRQPPNKGMPAPATSRSWPDAQPTPAASAPAASPSSVVSPSSQLHSPPPKEQERIHVKARPGPTPCILVCVMGDCSFTTLGSVPMTLTVGRVRPTPDCRTVGILDGEFRLRYRSNGRWSIPWTVRTNTSVAQVVDAYPPDPCGTISPQCLQERMNSKIRPDGWPLLLSEQMRAKFDAPKSAWLLDGGAGAPCSLGLPCGPVLEPMKGVWEFNLTDESIEGQWLIMKGEGGEQSDRLLVGRGAVRGGKVVAELRLSPGDLYRYRLVDKSGRALSSGNFFVLTPRMDSEVRDALRRKADSRLPQSVWWVDTLADLGLDWDAYRELRALE